MYVVVRDLRYDSTKLRGAAKELGEFQQLHASQPGYVGSLTVDAGQGRQIVVNIWQSEAEARAAREAVEPAVPHLLEPLMVAPAQLVGAGAVIENDLIKQ